MKKPLTAQEALDKFKYIIIANISPKKLFTPFTWEGLEEDCVIPDGAIIVPIESVSSHQAYSWFDLVGWTADPECENFYKAVAE